MRVRLGVAVALPIKEEAERLGACLAALHAQRDCRGAALPSGCFGVLALVNNSSDGSAQLARELSAHMGFPLRVVERTFPLAQAHAGMARRAAMDAAAAWLEETGPGGIIATTDADSRVAPDWIAATLAELRGGVDAVAGAIVYDAPDELFFGDMLDRRGRLEESYARCLVAIADQLDPLPHDPPPHHATISGASLALSAKAYRAIGGLPIVPVGEDKALVAALLGADRKVRFSHRVRVATSGRLHGRAKGGAADTRLLRSLDCAAVCDAALEPAIIAYRRSLWRGRLRRLHAAGLLLAPGGWSAALGLPADAAAALLAEPAFGARWAAIEASSPRLVRRPLSPADLPDEIVCAERALHALGRMSQAGQPVEPVAFESLLS